VVKDLVQGKGRPIPPPSPEPTVEFSIVYKAVDYDTGELYEENWDPKSPWPFRSAPGEMVPGLEKGLVGMREGGRRELIVPSGLAYGNGALVYVVKVVEVRKLG